ncbi:hypothetical protein KZP23_07565 [Echinicola marina]|uniref:hypothetical protein n=1 Tax=Echinicola marina TaxID=2859768 RepID=UPI001CF6138C|nr:hypothetical protein [Echinicola marina]UCS94858.1 hypothetical protein KZP23_07565 [Echinicola marina]
MAGHKLKLNSYSIRLKKYRKKDVGDVLFEEYFDTFRTESDDSTVNYNILFRRFFDGFVKSFNSEYLEDKDKTKAFTISDSVNHSPSNFIIDGFFEGGLTGIEQYVENKKRRGEKKPIKKDDVSSLPFYFLFWFPRDTNYGVVMIQSYNNSTINSLIKTHLRRYFNISKFTFDEDMCITKKDKDDFFNQSKVQELSFLNIMETTKDGEFSTLLGGHKKYKVEVRIKNIDENSNVFFRKYKDLKKSVNDLFDLSIEDSKVIERHEAKAYYKTETSSSHAVISDHKNFIPSMVLDESLKKEDSQIPDLDKIRAYCRTYLKQLQVENKYNSNFTFK